jgi:2-polyprenyl-3-methyl-5-hydroxy-6-metoxy-1,4-benzoquinol methylase
LNKYVVPFRRKQEEIQAYFQAQSSYWKDIYASSGPQAEIYRLRQAIVLAWIDDLVLAPGSRVLEVGCGAGFLSVELAKRGFRVHAIDAAETMVELTRRQAEESGVTELLSVGIGDVCDLAFEDGSFDLVTALGVIPWLERPVLAIREMARVTVPGGHVLLTDGNQMALNLLLDPWKNPALALFRRRLKEMLERIGFLHQSPKPTMAIFHDRRFIDGALASAELRKIKWMTLGFGTFTFLHRKVLPERLGIELHHWLQSLANRNVPLFRSTGLSYLVLATKPALLPSKRSSSAEQLTYSVTKGQSFESGDVNGRSLLSR